MINYSVLYNIMLKIGKNKNVNNFLLDKIKEIKNIESFITISSVMKEDLNLFLKKSFNMKDFFNFVLEDKTYSYYNNKTKSKDYISFDKLIITGKNIYMVKRYISDDSRFNQLNIFFKNLKKYNLNFKNIYISNNEIEIDNVEIFSEESAVKYIVENNIQPLSKQNDLYNTRRIDFINSIKKKLKENEEQISIQSICSTYALNLYFKEIETIYLNKINNKNSDIGIIEDLNKFIENTRNKKSYQTLIKSKSINFNKEDKKKLKLINLFGTCELGNIKKIFQINFKKFDEKMILKIINLMEFDNNKFYLKDGLINFIELFSSSDLIEEDFSKSHLFLKFGKKNHEGTNFIINKLEFESENGLRYQTSFDFGINNIPTFENIIVSILEKKKVSFYAGDKDINGNRILNLY